jgi:hypothetical protein
VEISKDIESSKKAMLAHELKVSVIQQLSIMLKIIIFVSVLCHIVIYLDWKSCQNVYSSVTYLP